MGFLRGLPQGSISVPTALTTVRQVSWDHLYIFLSNGEQLRWRVKKNDCGMLGASEHRAMVTIFG